MAVTVLESLLMNGGSLRYRQTYGFYVVQRGTKHGADQAEAEEGVRRGKYRPESNGPDPFGVYHFTRSAR